jgi:hypothetical protein
MGEPHRLDGWSRAQPPGVIGTMDPEGGGLVLRVRAWLRRASVLLAAPVAVIGLSGCLSSLTGGGSGASGSGGGVGGVPSGGPHVEKHHAGLTHGVVAHAPRLSGGSAHHRRSKGSSSHTQKQKGHSGTAKQHTKTKAHLSVRSRGASSGAAVTS